MPDVTLAIDGASLVGGLTTAGTIIAGGLIGSAKLLIGYLRHKDTAFNKLIDRFFQLAAGWQQEQKAGTEALISLKDEMSGLRQDVDHLADRVGRIDGGRKLPADALSPR